ncbi:hypothetical protein ACWEFD_11905 [Streptomyces ardesiacus]|uniref:hypothetical protein n=1 Tax=Streptomyces ardesiacus TaxID=285564 RepID=UPI003F4B544F
MSGDDQRGRLAGHVLAQGAAEGWTQRRTLRVGSAKTIASTEGMSTPSAIRREFARIAQSAAANAVKVSARWAGVCSPWAKNSCGGDVRDEGGIGAGQQAQGVREFAGEAAGVGDEVEVDQHLAQAVFGHGAQDAEVQGSGAQRTVVLRLPLPRGGGAGRACEGGEVEAAAQVGVGEGGHHDAVVGCAAVGHGLRERVFEDLFAVDGLVVYGVDERARVRPGSGDAAARAGQVGGLGQLGCGEDPRGGGHVEAAVRGGSAGRR